MPPFNPQEFYKDFLGHPYLGYGHHYLTKIGLLVTPYGREQPRLPPERWSELAPPSDWKDLAWHYFTLCFFRHDHDVPNEWPDDLLTLVEEYATGSPTAAEQIENYNVKDLPKYNQTQVRFQAYIGMFMLFAREYQPLLSQLHAQEWDIENAIEAIYDLWAEVNKKHKGRFKSPLAPIIEAWIADQIPKAKPEHRPRQIAPGFLKDSRLVKTDTLLPIGQMHAQAPESPMLPRIRARRLCPRSSPAP